MFCPMCGNEVSDNSKFCSECGYDLEKKEISKEKKTYKKTIFIGLVLIFVVLAIIGLNKAIEYLEVKNIENRHEAVQKTFSSIYCNTFNKDFTINEANQYITINYYDDFTFNDDCTGNVRMTDCDTGEVYSAFFSMELSVYNGIHNWKSVSMSLLRLENDENLSILRTPIVMFSDCRLDQNFKIYYADDDLLSAFWITIPTNQIIYDMSNGTGKENESVDWVYLAALDLVSECRDIPSGSWIDYEKTEFLVSDVQANENDGYKIEGIVGYGNDVSIRYYPFEISYDEKGNITSFCVYYK